jgi:hypothetical protein
VAHKAPGRKVLETWKIFGIFLEIFGRGGKWMTVYPHGGNKSPLSCVDINLRNERNILSNL